MYSLCIFKMLRDKAARSLRQCRVYLYANQIDFIRGFGSAIYLVNNGCQESAFPAGRFQNARAAGEIKMRCNIPGKRLRRHVLTSLALFYPLVLALSHGTNRILDWSKENSSSLNCLN